MTTTSPTDVAMRPELAAKREKLMQLWLAIPDHPPPEEVAELNRQSAALADGIAWLDAHPQAELDEYLAWSRARKGAGR